MKVEKVLNGIRYTLSNENLEVGDEVFPIANGRCLGGNDWIFHNITYNEYSTGFPDNPHVIQNLHYSDSKPYEVSTNHGYSPRECYFKIIKKERHVAHKGSFMTTHTWVTLNENDEPMSAFRNVSACDQGHYGCTLCSNCGEDVEDHFDECPNCKHIFIGNKYD